MRSEGARRPAALIDGAAEQTALQTVAAGHADRMGVSPDAKAAESALAYYTVLLKERSGSLFECQRAQVYWETDADRTTIYRNSPEHELILDAGAYDVSARLLPENLRVDDGWVARKNPGVIVKAVDGSVLGSGVLSAGRAAAVYGSLLSREEWRAVDAVRSGRVILLSAELLATPYGRTAAMLMILKAASPAQMEDVEPAQAYAMMAEEEAGKVPAGMFFYTGKDAISMNILIVDGQGGRLGRKLLEGVRKACPSASITAVGTNSIATANMMNSGCADRLATGENALIVACRTADIIAGPFGIATADAMLGEISPAMANAVASSAAYRVLLPMNLCGTYVAGVTKGSAAMLDDAVEAIRQLAEKQAPCAAPADGHD